MPTSKLNTSDLAQYLRTELYEKWATDRKEIEKKWQTNENAFKGVSEGFWKTGETEAWRSNTFIMLTKIKVLSAYSMIIDMLLQGGQLPFALDLSPWDQVTLEDLPPEKQEAVQDQIDDMTALIQQQILDCKGDRELMKCVMSGAKLGETYWRSFVHEITRRGFKTLNMAPRGTPNPDRFARHEYFEESVTVPGFEYVSCWDMFRDLETDDMQKSRGYCQREFDSPYDLRKLKGQAYYVDEAIDRLLENHSKGLSKGNKENMRPGLRNIKNRYNTIEKLTFWCRVPRKIVEKFEAETEGKETSSLTTDFVNDGDEVEIGAVLAEDEVIRLVRVRPESRPHGRVVWEIDLDGTSGTGIADNVQSVQMVLNGMVRAFEDNKKLAANVIAGIKKSLLLNWSGEFKPGELIEVAEEARTAAEAIQQIVIQDVGQTLLDGIGLMERYADEVSMLPKILQGATFEKQKPDTLGEINILQANAGKYLGSVIKNFDEGMIEPIVSRFYEYNMMDETVQKGKGSYIVKALGFAGFQDKVVRLSKILQALNLAISSPAIAAETRLKSLLEQVWRGLDIDPQQVAKSKQEKEEDAQAMMQARQQEMDEQGVVILAKHKAKMEEDASKIQEQHKAELEQIEAEHRNKLEELDAESENRIVEERATSAGEGKE